MIKKSVLIISIVLLLLSQISYATEYSLADFDNKIDIVSPSIGTSGNVIIANNLYISIRIDEPIESHIKLVKVEEFEIEMGILDKVFLNIELTEEEKDQIYGANIARNYFSLRDRLEKLKNKVLTAVVAGGGANLLHDLTDKPDALFLVDDGEDVG